MTSPEPTPPPLPREPVELIRQVDAQLLARERSEWATLRQGLAFHWYELFLLAGLFAFSIGLVVTIIFGLPADNEPLYFFMVLWSVGWVGMAIVCFEFLLRRYRLLRRAFELVDRRLERLEGQNGRLPPTPPSA
jgi:hypothetical protein